MSASLNIRNLHKRYGDLEVLRGINLEIPAGQTVAVIGPSGSGKSTLLRVLMTLDRPTSGDIEIDEQRVTWTIAISQGAQPLWQTELSATNAVSVTIDSDAGAAAQQQSVEQQTIQKMWENAASRLLAFEPPRHLFSPEAARGLGRSSLTPQGAVAALGQ